MHQSTNDEELQYTKVQEGLRKVVERAFGVFQVRLQVQRNGSFYFFKEDIIMTITCVILPNMLVRTNQTRSYADNLREEEQLVEIAEYLIWGKLRTDLK